MNRKIGVYGSAVNTAAVVAFAVSMIIGTEAGSYFSSIFIALGFVPMMCAFAVYADLDRKAAGVAAAVFAGIYAVFILVVYYAQLTAVAQGGLDAQALGLLDYTRFGLFFSYDLLGYGVMAVSTFFAGLTIKPDCKSDKWLKALLLIHGVFAVSCFIMPLLGVFSPDMQGADFIGIAVLEFWCAYFLPVGILSILHFKRQQ